MRALGLHEGIEITVDDADLALDVVLQLLQIVSGVDAAAYGVEAELHGLVQIVARAARDLALGLFQIDKSGHFAKARFDHHQEAVEARHFGVQPGDVVDDEIGKILAMALTAAESVAFCNCGVMAPRRACAALGSDR